MVVQWNTSMSHHRKFIKRHGKYLENGTEKEGDIFFWGEYEPQSNCIIANVCAYKAIHYGLSPVRNTIIPPKALNTDPYVFGDHFKNICCGIKNRKYQPNDVILFGKIEKDVFKNSYYLILDTVFVVKEKVNIDYNLNKTQYFKASIEPLHIQNKVYFYRGENYASGKQYYSYVPCRLDHTPRCKPKLDLASLGFKVNKGGRGLIAAHIIFSNNLWNMIRDSVINQGWLIGTYINKI